jgi:hypothetical protein
MKTEANQDHENKANQDHETTSQIEKKNWMSKSASRTSPIRRRMVMPSWPPTRPRWAVIHLHSLMSRSNPHAENRHGRSPPSTPEQARGERDERTRGPKLLHVRHLASETCTTWHRTETDSAGERADGWAAASYAFRTWNVTCIAALGGKTAFTRK